MHTDTKDAVLATLHIMEFSLNDNSKAENTLKQRSDMFDAVKSFVVKGSKLVSLQKIT